MEPMEEPGPERGMLEYPLQIVGKQVAELKKQFVT
jgi:hypothetical protein